MKYKGSSAPRWCSVNTAVSPPPCFSFCFLCCFGSRGSLTQRARLWFPISRCVLSALGGPAQPASSPQCGPDLAGVMAPHSLLSVLFHFWNCVFEPICALLLFSAPIFSVVSVYLEEMKQVSCLLSRPKPG